MLYASAARSIESIEPAGFLHRGLTLLLGAVEPLGLRQGNFFLILDRAAVHYLAGSYVLLCSSTTFVAE